MGRILKHTASVAAIVALAGGVWYAYQSGDGGAESVAPLITATGGPDKIAPKDPGGMKVPHRDKEVYTRFETSSGKTRNGMEKQAGDGKKTSTLPPPPPAFNNPLYGKKPGAEPDAKGLTKTSAGRSATQPGGETGRAAKPAAPIAKAPAKAAPRKKATARPIPTVPKRATARTPTTTTRNSTSNGDIPKYIPRKGPLPRTTAGLIGPFRIQIGSYKSGDYAMQRWFRLKSRHRDLLGNLVVVIERVNLGSRGYIFRLQAGPLENRGQVKGLCHLLGQRKIACSLVRG